MLTRDGLDAAERYFTQALEKDPTDAAAWAGIAGVWTGSRRRLAAVWAARYGKPRGARALRLADTQREAGNKDRAFEWLERAYDERDPNMPHIGGPRNDSLRADPRFQGLQRRMNQPR